MRTEQMTASPVTRAERGIGSMGTIARVATGLGLLFLAGLAAHRGDLQWFEAFIGLIGLPLLVMGIVVATKRILGTSSYLQATGSIGTLVNLSIIAALFVVPWTTEIAYFFYGIPMFIAAWRGYPGCEMLAMSNLVLRRQDELGCPWFWPIDTLEAWMRTHSRTVNG